MSEQSTIEVPVLRNDESTLKKRLTDNAYEQILPARYLKKNEDGEVIEEQEELFKRVAKNIAIPEALHHENAPEVLGIEHTHEHFDIEEFEEYLTEDGYLEFREETARYISYDNVFDHLNREYPKVADVMKQRKDEFQDMMEHLKLMPNSPTLMNAGDELQQLAACFTLHPEDDMEHIHEEVKKAAMVQQSGGGVGYSFTDLRPYGDTVGSTGGIASGPISFMRTFDQMTDTIRQGGCISHDERVVTQEGYIPISEIHEGPTHSRDSTSHVISDRKGQYNRAIESSHSGGMDVIEITTKSGYSLKLTPNHEILSSNTEDVGVMGRSFIEFQEASELEEGQTIPVSIQNQISPKRESLNELESESHFNTYDDIKFPREVTDSFAKFIGLLWGDGCMDVNNNRIVFTLGKEGHADSKAMDFITDYLNSLNLNYRVQDEEERGKGKCYRIGFESVRFTEWLLKNGINKETDDLSKIPECIFRSPAAIPSFLGGMTCDAAVNYDAGIVQYSTKSSEYASVLQLLLSFCGIPAKIRRLEPSEDRFSDKESFVVSSVPGDYSEKFFSDIPHFFTNLPDYSDGQRQEQIDFIGEYLDLQLLLHFKKNNKTEDDVDGSSLKELRRYQRGERHPSKKRLRELLQNVGITPPDWMQDDIYLDEIESVKNAGEAPVCDIEVIDGKPEYIASNFIVHNSRRGAQMGMLRMDHPDIPLFIHAKNKDVSLAQVLLLNDPDDPKHNSFGEALEEARELIDEEGRVPEHLRNAAEGHLSNFNISALVDDEFMEALENGENYTLINPRTEEAHIATEETKELYGWFDLDEYVTVGEELTLPASVLWDHLLEGAWENGEPGVVYIDTANDEHAFDIDKHPEHIIQETNPCGEIAMSTYDACNLMHINLSTIVDRDAVPFAEFDGNINGFLQHSIDWQELDYRICVGTRFLDNVITMSDYPIDEIDETVQSMRRIGLGIMGLAQLYVQLGVEYGSEEGDEIARQIMSYINHNSKRASHKLSKERSVFDEWNKSKFAEPTEYPEWFEKHVGCNPNNWEDGYPLRNMNTTMIAPCGTTGMVADTTGGCEPIFNVAFYKNVSDDIQGDEMLVEFDNLFLKTLEKNDIDVDSVKSDVAEMMNNNEYNTPTDIPSVPDELGSLFTTASELNAEDHASVQCALQEGVDSSISKTTNASFDSTVDDAKDVFEYIYENGGKAVTFYRDGSRTKQVKTTRKDNQDVDDEPSTDKEREVPFHREAPNVLDDVERHRIRTGSGKLYVTIGEDEHGVVEVMATVGKSGGQVESFTEALARQISQSLQWGVPVEEVIDQLQNIKGPDIGYDGQDIVHSVPDGIALALKRYTEDKEMMNHPTTDVSKDIEQTTDASECPECGAMALVQQEGCNTCLPEMGGCSYSKCS